MSSRLNAIKTRVTQLPSIAEGVVVNVSDPQEQGRVQVWCPGIDGENTSYDALPWAKVVSPLFGQITNYPAGSRGNVAKGLMSFGWWSIPPIHSIVEVGFLYNDPNQRRVLGCVGGDHSNRSIPVGRNRPDIGAKAPVTDTLDPVEPQTTNLNEQFAGNLDASEARTRGVYERQAGNDSNNRNGSEGYQKTPYPNDDRLTPQTHSFTTPGRHALIFQDNPANGRVRLKTADGHQIILDDANERIYVSTCSGKTWVELDRDGHINIYGSESISVGAGKDINFTAGGDFNVSAVGSINLNAGKDLLASSCGDLHINGKSLAIEASADMNLLASSTILATGSTIHLNGPTAKSAKCPNPPPIIPNHEPWVRPISKTQRGPNWKA